MARKTSRGARRTEILTAALRLIRRGGTQRLSTAALAAEANCSKETLYNWFGDKQGILAALAEAQSEALNHALEVALEDAATPPLTKLEHLTAALVDLATGDASLAILRTAMEDASGALGTVVLEQGRTPTGRLFARLIEQAQSEGVLGPGDPTDMADRLVTLAVGDRQVRALLGESAARPKGEAFGIVAASAVADLQRLYPS